MEIEISKYFEALEIAKKVNPRLLHHKAVKDGIARIYLLDWKTKEHFIDVSHEFEDDIEQDYIYTKAEHAIMQKLKIIGAKV